MDKLEEYCLMARSAKGRSVAQIVLQATSEPGLFAFGELLDVPSVQELQNSDQAQFYELLCLFAHGTWSNYKASAASLPALNPNQQLKLKQLTVVSLAESAKVLEYSKLMEELDVSNVRELEDLLITHCMNTGVVRGKLDQRKRCFDIQYAAGRDMAPGQISTLVETLQAWEKRSAEVMTAIEEKLDWARCMHEAMDKHKADMEAKEEETKNTVKLQYDNVKPDHLQLRGRSTYSLETTYNFEGGVAGMDFTPTDEDRGPSSRTKRRR